MFYDWKELKIGDWQFKKLVRAFDGLVLFEKRSEDFTGLCFTAEEAGSTVSLVKKTSASKTLNLMTSRDKQRWTSYTQGDVIVLENVGDKVYFKNSQTMTSLNTSTTNYNKFVMTGKIAASGNIMSLLSPDYKDLLKVGRACFAYLFNQCESLTKAPKLPATTLFVDCYYGMFRYCTSLTKAPELPATTLYSGCYTDMFRYCSSLQYIKVNFNVWSQDTSTWVKDVAPAGNFICPAELPDVRGESNIPTGWTKVDLVDFTGLCFTAEEDNSTIQLKKFGSAPTLSLMKSDDGIIWSSYIQDDIITLATAGDKVYFKNSTTVTQLGNSASNYNKFVMTGKIAASGNIMSLLSPDFDGELTMGTYCFSYLFQNCSSLTTAPELPATTLADRCYIRMFFGCTSLTQAPSTLPAEKAEIQSYAQMFLNCTSLTTAPEMLVTSFNGQSLVSMFYGCSSLQQIKVHFKSWPTSTDLRTWVNGVSPTGTFICPAELPDVRGANNIPEGWTKQDLLT